MPRLTILNAIERKFILLVGDLLLVLASLNVLVNHAIDEKFSYLELKVSVFLIGVVVYFTLAYILDFYNLEKGMQRKNIISQSLYITALYVLITFMACVLLYDVSFWRIPLLAFLVLTPIQIGLWRLLFGNLFRIFPITKKVLYIYDNQNVSDLKKDIKTINGIEMKTFYKVKLTFPVENNSLSHKQKFLSATEKIDTWLINVKNYNSLPPDLEKLILNAILKGKEVISYTSFYENTYEALPIRSHNDSFYEILQLRNKKIRYLQKIFSFGINALLTLLVGFVFLLCLPFVYLLNIFFNRGPLFYSQKRVGRFGEEFKIYKFRSMVVDAEKTGAKMATRNDNRITPVGRFLRAFRIDELPQIISVVQGNMQFIGPRPERKFFVTQLNQMIPFYNARHLIKPGITGWAQVKYKYGENLEDSIKKLEYDLYYIKNRSITLDLRIVFKTITTVIFSRGL